MEEVIDWSIPVNNFLLTGTVPVNYSLLTGSVPVNNSLLTGTVPVNNSLLTGALKVYSFHITLFLYNNYTGEQRFCCMGFQLIPPI